MLVVCVEYLHPNVGNQVVIGICIDGVTYKLGFSVTVFIDFSWHTLAKWPIFWQLVTFSASCCRLRDVGVHRVSTFVAFSVVWHFVISLRLCMRELFTYVLCIIIISLCISLLLVVASFFSAFSSNLSNVISFCRHDNHSSLSSMLLIIKRFIILSEDQFWSCTFWQLCGDDQHSYGTGPSVLPGFDLMSLNKAKSFDCRDEKYLCNFSLDFLYSVQFSSLIPSGFISMGKESWIFSTSAPA